MKLTLNIVGVILVVFGATWFLQGINVLPGQLHDGADSMGVYWKPVSRVSFPAVSPRARLRRRTIPLAIALV